MASDLKFEAPIAPKLILWLIDTRSLWTVTPEARPHDEVLKLPKVAVRAFKLLSQSERESVLKYHHLKDAKMSLASHLLKHLVITKYLGVPWSRSHISRSAHGKPCYLHDPAQAHIDFNVSHQAGLVSLIALIGCDKSVQVGTDIVCTDERRRADYEYIDREGFSSWVDIYEDVFADSELKHLRSSLRNLEDIGVYLKGAELTECGRIALLECQRRDEKVDLEIVTAEGISKEIQVKSDIIIESKLRRFYALWCVREAFIKMTGEAFFAPWLKDLEFVQVEAPKSRPDATGMENGDLIKDFEIFRRSSPSRVPHMVKNVKMSLAALGKNFMIAGAICTPNGVPESDFAIENWRFLDLESDILNVVETS
ncbi:unnamed protein product [Blumeria hordei]|uniref:holo-[acyl-carrier-protein] synthase n=2 Tax=Blumeria hordei TaxID=2867405 RepID=A0A383URJ1_BLUHO|nr:phosphopantetheinyl transferase [Blumeria hordei DH14]SZF02507.1 unnamed protein product [Blumeria hordei]